MAKSTTNQASKPLKAKDVELTEHYRQIGPAAILGALACKMKQAATDKTEQPIRARRAA